MASNVGKQLEKLLECGICLERFEEPKMLSCQHTYCKKCLERLVRGDKVTCPECRKGTEVQRGDVTRLKPSLVINNLLSLPDETLFCEEHPKEVINLFCEYCDQVICCVCAVMGHLNHQSTYLEKAFPAQKENIMAFVTKASENIPDFKAAIESVQKRERDVQENSKAVRQEVDVFINEHIASLQRTRKSLKRDLKRLTLDQMAELHNYKEFLSSILGRVEGGVQDAKQVLASGSEAKVLSKKNQIIKQMKELGSFTVPPVIRDTIFYELEENETVEKMATISQRGEFQLSMLGGEPGVIYTTRAKQTCNFVITPRKKDEAAVREDDDIRVVIEMLEVKSPSPDIKCNEPEITRSEDGTYSFSYCPDGTGRYNIEIVINGMHSCGSPVTWHVEPALYLPGLLNKTATAFKNVLRGRRASERDDVLLSECVFQDGQHSWKTQLRLDERTPTTDHHRLGVIHLDGKGRSSLAEGQCLELSNANGIFQKKVQPSLIRSFQNGAVFVCFLNIDKGQLIIYNEQTKQSETFFHLQPPISPLIHPEESIFFKVQWKTVKKTSADGP